MLNLKKQNRQKQELETNLGFDGSLSHDDINIGHEQSPIKSRCRPYPTPTTSPTS